MGLAAEMLLHARKLGGRPDQVISAVDGWFDAAKKLDDSTNKMFASYNDLGTNWEGPAFKTYQEFMQRNIDLTDASFDALVAAGMQLINTYKEVVTACGHRNTAIAKAFIAISDAAGLWLGNGTENEAEKAQVKNALQVFALEYSEIKNTLQSTLASYTADIKSIEGEVLSVSAPGVFPDSALNRKKWEKT
ncbi:hypothetical protein [Spirillospora sp. NPDC047279]|uniref:hypothetical protein n=1 Tax=Spirillospora sp. NPDC047279 TaxID=3155478 RepID=UPI00340788FE